MVDHIEPTSALVALVCIGITWAVLGVLERRRS